MTESATRAVSVRGAQAGQVVHRDDGVGGHGPREDLCASPVAADEHTLQRLGVLGPVGVSRDAREKV